MHFGCKKAKKKERRNDAPFFCLGLGQTKGSVPLAGLDGEVAEVDAFGALVGVGVAHSEPAIDAVAAPGGG